MTYMFVPTGIRAISEPWRRPVCLTETVSQVCFFQPTLSACSARC